MKKYESPQMTIHETEVTSYILEGSRIPVGGGGPFDAREDKGWDIWENTNGTEEE